MWLPKVEGDCASRRDFGSSGRGGIVVTKWRDCGYQFFGDPEKILDRPWPECYYGNLYERVSTITKRNQISAIYTNTKLKLLDWPDSLKLVWHY